MVIDESIVHLQNFEFRLPIDNARFKNLIEKNQQRLEEIKLIFIGKVSMLQQHELYYSSEQVKRLREKNWLLV